MGVVVSTAHLERLIDLRGTAYSTPRLRGLGRHNVELVPVVLAQPEPAVHRRGRFLTALLPREGGLVVEADSISEESS